MGPDSFRGVSLAAESGFTRPILIDPESEIFRNYRVGGFVYPLNIVIDRDGNIAYMDTATSYEEGTTAAIMGAL